MTVRSSFIALTLCLLPTTIAAQPGDKDSEPLIQGIVGGSITDGINLWAITGASMSVGTLNDLEVPIGTDHQYTNWFWYRVGGDTAESLLPLPDTESYSGALATFTWADVDGRGLFSAELNVFLVAQGPGAALLSSLDVTNISATPVDLDLFAYSDMDMDGTPANDSAVETTTTQIDIAEIAVAFFLGNQADAYAVDAFPVVRNELNDDEIDNFSNTGLPFGPGDYAGAYQWGRTVPPAETQNFSTLICVDTLDQCPTFFVVFEDNFETGDTGLWDTTVP